MTIQEDQAAGLRLAQSAKKPVSIPRNLRCIAVGSGKGGVGKTMISIGLSFELVRLNHRVLLMDADLGLANIDIQIGVDPEFTLQDVVFGNCPIEKALVKIENGPDILPSASGAADMADMGDARRQLFVEKLISFAANYDFFIIDAGAGIGRSIITFLAAAPEVLVVVANEPTSIMDAYSLVKRLAQEPAPPSMMMVVNMVRSLDEGEQLAVRLNTITRRFLNIELPAAGVVMYDQCVGDAIRARRPVSLFAPKSAPARCIADIARFLVSPRARAGQAARLDERFFENLAGLGVMNAIENAG